MQPARLRKQVCRQTGHITTFEKEGQSGGSDGGAVKRRTGPQLVTSIVTPLAAVWI
jgi:hypothetical protein